MLKIVRVTRNFLRFFYKNKNLFQNAEIFSKINIPISVTCKCKGADRIQVHKVTGSAVVSAERRRTGFDPNRSPIFPSRSLGRHVTSSADINSPNSPLDHYISGYVFSFTFLILQFQIENFDTHATSCRAFLYFVIYVFYLYNLYFLFLFDYYILFICISCIFL